MEFKNRNLLLVLLLLLLLRIYFVHVLSVLGAPDVANRTMTLDYNNQDNQDNVGKNICRHTEKILPKSMISINHLLGKKQI